ncbi:MAG: arylsulfatase [Planctomycetota bacterium]|nr:arylsulfatase [Planctomycetota bacterium]
MRLVLVALLASACAAPAGLQTAAEPSGPPNIVYILADDLGYGEVGAYGQDKIRTPHIDRLAAGGMRFTQHYSGAPVCAPSRCVLLTGRDLAHAEIRGNKEVQPEGQHPISAGLVTIPELLKTAGYHTAAMGKWGLGPVGSSGDPNAQGFDLFFGYNCQRQAHTYYPDHLWRNGVMVPLPNDDIPGHAKLAEAPAAEAYGAYYGDAYAPDLMMTECEAYLRSVAPGAKAGDQPFFLYLPFVEPHLAMQPPAELVATYPAEWDEAPYLGTRGYTPHPRPRAGYAAMITDLDQHVGDVVRLLEELGLAENTLVIFSSDNGPTHDVGGVDTTFFDSAGGLRGRKGSVYEGGLRVPMIASWPGRIEPGSTTDHVSAFQDVLPTLCEVASVTELPPTEGISYLPTLLQTGDQASHGYLAWEFFGYGGQKAVRMGDWKAVRRETRRDSPGAIELYDLGSDPAESLDVAADHPEVVAEAERLFREARLTNPTFPQPLYDV